MSLHEHGVDFESYLPPLRTIPEGGTRDDASYVNWGFTIYRTAYGGTTDQAWQTLLRKIQDDLAEEGAYYKEHHDDYWSTKPANPEAADKFMSLFKLDPRSDPDLLEGATMAQVREIYQKGIGGPPMTHEIPQYHLFLLADTEVLDAVAKGEFWMKCVQGEYKAEDYTIKDEEGVPTEQLFYYGYIKMTVQSLLVLWDRLSIRNLGDFSPPFIEEPVRIWNGDW